MNLAKFNFLICVFTLISAFFYLSFISSFHQQLTSGPQDIFYYLVYARELSFGNYLSWNGLFPSSGFHPLWMLILSIVHLISNDLFFINIIINVILLFLSITSIYFIAHTFEIKKNIFINIYFLFIILFINKYYFWFMESALVCTNLVIYFYLIFKRSNRIFLISFFVSISILSRLDVFLIIAPLHFFIFLKYIIEKKYKNSLFLSIIPILFVGSYLIFLKINTGYFFPLSGIVKSSFPNLFEKSSLEIILWIKNDGLMLLMIIILINILLVFIKLYSRNKIFNQNYFYITNANIGLILYIFYHYAFTSSPEIGNWYFAAGFLVLVFNILYFLYFIQGNKLILSNQFFNILDKSRLIILILSIFFIFFSTNVIFFKKLDYDFKTRQSYHYYDFVINNQQFLKKNIKILDTGDGAFAYYSKLQTYHAKGLAGTSAYINFIKNFDMTNHIHDLENIAIYKKYINFQHIDYVIYYTSYKSNFFNNLCDKNFYELYDIININKEIRYIIGLIKAESYESFLKFCIN